MRHCALILSLALVLTPLPLKAQQPADGASLPRNGIVPDTLTAIRMAVAVAAPVYGKRVIGHQRPLRATLRDSIWTVVGTLPPNSRAGLLVVQIVKRDGRIVRMSHGPNVPLSGP